MCNCRGTQKTTPRPQNAAPNKIEGTVQMLLKQQQQNAVTQQAIQNQMLAVNRNRNKVYR